MATIKIIDPVPRIEGHLKIEITIDGGVIKDAKASGTLFRGFENLLVGRVPEDAPLITQRICGVCPISHAQASVLALENVGKYKASKNGRLLRNLILGANYIQSHILHFYVLSAVDFMAGPATTPWIPVWDVDMRAPEAFVPVIKYSLPAALEARRQAQEMGAIFSAKMPHASTYVAGGITTAVTQKKIDRFAAYLTGLTNFINKFYIPDVLAVAGVYSDHAKVGVGPQNFLSYGVFEEDDNYSKKLLKAGYKPKGSRAVPMSVSGISEHVKYSWYKDETNGKNPSVGETVAQDPATKKDAYSWLKAPRYKGKVCELGPLARMKINGDYNGKASAIARHHARALETKKIADRIPGWLNQLTAGPGYDASYKQAKSASGMGLTEAPRGALGHWADIDAAGKLSRYQVITPTCWNAAPKDSSGVRGALEQALIGAPITDETKPIEALRIVHSFDPCIACAVHVTKASGEKVEVVRPGTE